MRRKQREPSTQTSTHSVLSMGCNVGLHVLDNWHFICFLSLRHSWQFLQMSRVNPAFNAHYGARYDIDEVPPPPAQLCVCHCVTRISWIILSLCGLCGDGEGTPRSQIVQGIVSWSMVEAPADYWDCKPSWRLRWVPNNARTVIAAVCVRSAPRRAAREALFRATPGE